MNLRLARACSAAKRHRGGAGFVDQLLDVHRDRDGLGQAAGLCAALAAFAI